MADIYGEVEDDLRAEQARLLARKYGLVVAAVLLAAIAAVGIWQALIWQHARSDARLSAQYFSAMQVADKTVPADQSSNTAAAIAAFKPLGQSDAPEIRSLSRLRLAQLEGEAGHPAQALADLDAVASDQAAAPALRDLATLASVQRQMTTADPAALALRLQTIEQPGAPFRVLALETSAMLDVKRGRVAAARHTLQLLLADENATDGVRERANTLLQALSQPGAAR